MGEMWGWGGGGVARWVVVAHALFCFWCYSRTCYEQPPLRHKKSGLSRQVAAHRRFICIQNAILGDDHVASNRRLAAHKSGFS